MAGLEETRANVAKEIEAARARKEALANMTPNTGEKASVIAALTDGINEQAHLRKAREDRAALISALRSLRGSRPDISVMPDPKAGLVNFTVPPFVRDGQSEPGRTVSVKAGPELYRFLYKGGLNDLVKEYYDYTPSGEGMDYDNIMFDADPKVLRALQHGDWSHILGPENPMPTYMPKVFYPEDFPDRRLAGKMKVGPYYKYYAYRHGLYPPQGDKKTTTWKGREIPNPFSFFTFNERMNTPWTNMTHPMWEKIPLEEIEANKEYWSNPVMGKLNLKSGEVDPPTELPPGLNGADWDWGVARLSADHRGNPVLDAKGNNKPYDYLAEAERAIRDGRRTADDDYSAKYNNVQKMLKFIAKRLAGAVTRDEDGNPLGDFTNARTFLEGLEAERQKKNVFAKSLKTTNESTEYTGHSKNVPRSRFSIASDQEAEDINDLKRDPEKVYKEFLELINNSGELSEDELAGKIEDFLVENNYDSDVMALVGNSPVDFDKDGNAYVNLNETNNIMNRWLDEEGNVQGSTHKFNPRNTKKNYGSQKVIHGQSNILLRRGDKQLADITLPTQDILDKTDDITKAGMGLDPKVNEEVQRTEADENLRKEREGKAAKFSDDKKKIIIKVARQGKAEWAKKQRGINLMQQAKKEYLKNLAMQGNEDAIKDDYASEQDNFALANDNQKLENLLNNRAKDKAAQLSKETGGKYTVQHVRGVDKPVNQKGFNQYVKNFIKTMFNTNYPENIKILNNVGLGPEDKEGFRSWLDQGLFMQLNDTLKGPDLARELAARYADYKSKATTGMDSFSAGKFSGALSDMLGLGQ